MPPFELAKHATIRSTGHRTGLGSLGLMMIAGHTRRQPRHRQSGDAGGTGRGRSEEAIAGAVTCGQQCRYCKEPFKVESVAVTDALGESRQYPDLSARTMDVTAAYINSYIGIDLPPAKMAQLLTKMQLSSSVAADGAMRLPTAVPLHSLSPLAVQKHLMPWPPRSVVHRPCHLVPWGVRRSAAALRACLLLVCANHLAASRHCRGG